MRCFVTESSTTDPDIFEATDKVSLTYSNWRNISYFHSTHSVQSILNTQQVLESHNSSKNNSTFCCCACCITGQTVSCNARSYHEAAICVGNAARNVVTHTPPESTSLTYTQQVQYKYFETSNKENWRDDPLTKLEMITDHHHILLSSESIDTSEFNDQRKSRSSSVQYTTSQSESLAESKVTSLLELPWKDRDEIFETIVTWTDGERFSVGYDIEEMLLDCKINGVQCLARYELNVH